MEQNGDIRKRSKEQFGAGSLNHRRKRLDAGAQLLCMGRGMPWSLSSPYPAGMLRVSVCGHGGGVRGVKGAFELCTRLLDQGSTALRRHALSGSKRPGKIELCRARPGRIPVGLSSSSENRAVGQLWVLVRGGPAKPRAGSLSHADQYGQRYQVCVFCGRRDPLVSLRKLQRRPRQRTGEGAYGHHSLREQQEHPLGRARVGCCGQYMMERLQKIEAALWSRLGSKAQIKSATSRYIRRNQNIEAATSIRREPRCDAELH